MNRRLSIAVFLTMLSIFSFFGSRELAWGDARRIYEVAESIVDDGKLDITLPTGLVRDGKTYGVHPLLVSLLHVPGVALVRAIQTVAPRYQHLVTPFGPHLAPMLVGALGCLLFFYLCRDLGLSQVGASLSTLMVGLGTMVLVYARSPWSEIVQTTCFLGFFLWLLRAMRLQTRGSVLWLGMWAGLLLNTKFVYVLALPGAALVLGWRIWQRQGRRPTILLLGWASLALLPGVVMTLAYNHVRTGSPFHFGYVDAGAVALGPAFDEHLLVGVWGQLFSYGKSVFLYNPPLVLSVLCVPWMLRNAKAGLDWLWALLLTATPLFVLNSSVSFWSGDWCWGPRYLLFLVPPALLPACFWLDAVWERRWRWAQGVVAVVFALGVGVQFLGGIVYWDHFIRISHEARDSWLGMPKRTGSYPPDRGNACDPCFEDLSPMNWLPPFQPIEGHYWLFKHLARKHDWKKAEPDAPWHRYTRLTLYIQKGYGGSRVDWWPLEFKRPFVRLARVLVGLTIAWVLGCAYFWVLTLRRARAAPAPVVVARELPAA